MGSQTQLCLLEIEASEPHPRPEKPEHQKLGNEMPPARHGLTGYSRALPTRDPTVAVGLYPHAGAPQTCSISLTWELVRRKEPGAHPRSADSESDRIPR